MPRKGQKRKKTRTHVRSPLPAASPRPPHLAVTQPPSTPLTSLASAHLAGQGARCDRSERAKGPQVVRGQERDRGRECRAAHEGCQEGSRAQHGHQAQGESVQLSTPSGVRVGADEAGLIADFSSTDTPSSRRNGNPTASATLSPCLVLSASHT